jgi:hypothetical protein
MNDHLAHNPYTKAPLEEILEEPAQSFSVDFNKNSMISSEKSVEYEDEVTPDKKKIFISLLISLGIT